MGLLDKYDHSAGNDWSFIYKCKYLSKSTFFSFKRKKAFNETIFSVPRVAEPGSFIFINLFRPMFQVFDILSVADMLSHSVAFNVAFSASKL